MAKFYFRLWLFWALRLIVCTLAFAALFAFLVTFILYAKHGFAPLSASMIAALEEIFVFWFKVLLNLALLLALFRSVKYIFNRCHAGYMLRLQQCSKNETSFIEEIGYGDLIKVWRKWFMLLIWIVGALMILAVAFDWFNIYVLYGSILVAGQFSFMVLGARCKAVKVVPCSSF